MSMVDFIKLRDIIKDGISSLKTEVTKPVSILENPQYGLQAIKNGQLVRGKSSSYLKMNSGRVTIAAASQNTPSNENKDINLINISGSGSLFQCVGSFTTDSNSSIAGIVQFTIKDGSNTIVNFKYTANGNSTTRYNIQINYKFITPLEASNISYFNKVTNVTTNYYTTPSTVYTETITSSRTCNIYVIVPEEGIEFKNGLSVNINVGHVATNTSYNVQDAAIVYGTN